MEPRYKILLTNSTGMYGGGEFYVLSLARAMRDRGHDVVVSCRPDNPLLPKLESHNIPSVPLAFPPAGRLIHFIEKIRALVRERRIQIVHTNSNYDRTAGAFAARLGGAAHVTSVHSFHSLRRNVTHAIRNSLATDHFLVDGLCVREMLVDTDRVPGSKISIVHLGVDPASMTRSEKDRREVRREFGVADGEILIGNVARIVPMKGQEHLLHAFAEASLHHPEARLAVVGDGELREWLETLARRLGIAEKVVFAGFRDDLPRVYSAFDLYVHPSVEGGGETFPFAVLQALAQELPVIVTRVGDMPAMVEEGENGYVVPDRDTGALGARINGLLGDAALRARMSARSREILLRKFTLDRVADDVEAVYSRIVSARRR